jgi:hypothetical protein
VRNCPIGDDQISLNPRSFSSLLKTRVVKGLPGCGPPTLMRTTASVSSLFLHRAFPRCRVQGSCPMSACRIARRSCGEFGGAPAHRFYRVDDLEYLAAFAGASRLPREGHITQHDSAIDRVSQCGFLSVRFLFGDTLSVFLGFRPVLRHMHFTRKPPRDVWRWC